MRLEDVIKRIRKETVEGIMKKANSLPGNDLNDVKLSINEAREVLYGVLENIELEVVKERWR